MENTKETRINGLVPTELHRQLKVVLAIQGKSLKQFLIEACEREIGNAQIPQIQIQKNAS